jgi:hypothetical protein
MAETYHAVLQTQYAISEAYHAILQTQDTNEPVYRFKIHSLVVMVLFWAAGSGQVFICLTKILRIFI